jgi:Flp pilus assembly protein TadD
LGWPPNAHHYLGAIYENEGRKAEAKQSYEAALKLNPSLKDALDGLKRVSWRLGSISS